MLFCIFIIACPKPNLNEPGVPILTKRQNIFEDDRILQMGEQLRKLRKYHKLTINELAEYIQVSSKMVSNYENGNNVISLEIIIRIYESNAFEGRTLEEIIRLLILDVYS